MSLYYWHYYGWSLIKKFTKEQSPKKTTCTHGDCVVTCVGNSIDNDWQ